MKLFIVAALIAVASAARLEHLERSYLPPDQGSQYGSQAYNRPQGSFGSHGSGLGNSGFGSSFESNSLGSGRPSALSAGFPATSNQYLPPDHGPSGVSGHGQFSGSLTGFSARSQYQPQHGSQSGHFGSQGRSSFGSSLGGSQYGSAGSQYGSAGSQYGSAGQYNQFPSAGSQFPSAGSQFPSAGSQYSSAGSQYPSASSQYSSVSSQFPSASRQYLAPKSSFDNIPQQAFDEQTGYHY